MNIIDIEQLINTQLGGKVSVVFSTNSVKDLTDFDPSTQKKIIALIIKRGKKGPAIKPDGIGIPLSSPLQGFTKIKPASMGLRIIYRPVKLKNLIRMEIIAIGPRDEKKAYQLAAKRLSFFRVEMAQRNDD